MNRTFSFIKLDFMTVKPYLKMVYIVLLIILSLILSLTGNNLYSNGVLMAVPMVYMGDIFSISEKNNMDTLYITLSIKRSTVVFSRYLLMVIFNLFMGIVAFIFSFIMATLSGGSSNFYENGASILTLFLILTIEAIQLPVYFKIGYSKAQLFAVIAFIIFPFIPLAFVILLIKFLFC